MRGATILLAQALLSPGDLLPHRIQHFMRTSREYAHGALNAMRRAAVRVAREGATCNLRARGRGGGDWVEKKNSC